MGFFLIGIFPPNQIIPNVSAQEDGIEVPGITIGSNIITATPSYIIKADGTTQAINNGILQLGPDTTKYGYIAFKRSPKVYIPPEEIDTVFVRSEIDENGNTSLLYSTIIPCYFDYNVYTSFGQAAVNPYHNLPTLASNAQNQICVGRVYVGVSGDSGDADPGVRSREDTTYNVRNFAFGESVDFEAQTATGRNPVNMRCAPWNFNYGSILYSDMIGSTRSTQSWSYRGYESGSQDQTESFGYAWEFPLFDTGKAATFTTTHGNDGDPYFCSTKKTDLYFGNVPYVLMGGEADGTNIENYQLSSQFNAFTKYMQTSYVDIGAFTPVWSLAIQPFRALRDTVKLDEDGNVTLIMKNSKVSLVDAITLSGVGTDNFDASGFMEAAKNYNMDDTSAITTLPQDQAPAPKSGAGVGSGKGTPISTSYASTYGLSISSASPIVKDEIETVSTATTQTEAVFEYPQGVSLRCQDNNANKGKLITDESFDEKLMWNTSSWDMGSSSTRLRPAVQLLKKITTVNYNEFWVKSLKTTTVNAFGSVTGVKQAWGLYHNSITTPSEQTIPVLAGWAPLNVFIHQRVRVDLEVLSTYAVNIRAGNKNLSIIDDNPGSGYTPGEVPVDYYGTGNYNRNFTSTSWTTGFDWLDWFPELPIDQSVILSILILVAIVGAGIFVFYSFLKGRGIVGRGSGSASQVTNVNITRSRD